MQVQDSFNFLTVFFCLLPLNQCVVTLFCGAHRDYFAVSGFSTAIPPKWNQAFRRLLHTRECRRSCQVRHFSPDQFGSLEGCNVFIYFSHQYNALPGI